MKTDIVETLAKIYNSLPWGLQSGYMSSKPWCVHENGTHVLIAMAVEADLSVTDTVKLIEMCDYVGERDIVLGAVSGTLEYRMGVWMEKK